MLVVYICCVVILCFLQVVIGQPSRQLSARDLDSVLQDYAFRALVRPRTGIIYDGNVGSNLTGIEVAALRLRSGSLRRRGFVGYKEFDIPVGVVELPYVERIVLVYHNLGNWSSFYYPLPAGYTYLAPVLGLLAYDATYLYATNLSELDIRASGDPISIRFATNNESSSSSQIMCVYFGLDGSVGFDNLVQGNSCLTSNQGHFSIVVQSSVVAPTPAPSVGVGGGGEGRRSGRVWIISGSVVGGAALLVVFALVFGYAKKCRRRKKIRRMEEAAELGVPLPMTSVGYTKAPVAMETRTKPVLENEFVP